MKHSSPCTGTEVQSWNRKGMVTTSWLFTAWRTKSCSDCKWLLIISFNLWKLLCPLGCKPNEGQGSIPTGLVSLWLFHQYLSDTIREVRNSELQGHLAKKLLEKDLIQHQPGQVLLGPSCRTYQRWWKHPVKQRQELSVQRSNLLITSQRCFYISLCPRYQCNTCEETVL